MKNKIKDKNGIALCLNNIRKLEDGGVKMIYNYLNQLIIIL